MHQTPVPTNPPSSRSWDSRSARIALLLIIGMAVAAGFVVLQGRQQWRTRCLREYAMARSAADTARVDRMVLNMGKGGLVSCRSVRDPLAPRPRNRSF